MRRRRDRARTTVIGFLVAAAVAQLAFAVTLEFGPPRWRDPEWGRKMVHLQRLLVAEPQRPLVLVFGSSRVANGLRPEYLAPQQPNDPWVFNFALVGAGPVQQRLALERVLDAGVRPDRVILEFWPPHGLDGEADRVDANRLTYADLERVAGHAKEPADLRGRWVAGRFAPWYYHRQLFMNQLLPTWLPWSFRRDPEWAFDSTGWMRLPERPEAMRPVLMAQTYERCLPVIASPEPISCEGDRALQACLCRCQEAGISVQLLFMPESTEFRSWYPPITQMAVANYVDGLRRRGVSVIDARTWADDRDLPDGFHLDESGAICFTERLRPYLGFP